MGFSPTFSLLKPTFSLLLSPHLLAASASPYTERSPTILLASLIKGVRGDPQLR